MFAVVAEFADIWIIPLFASMTDDVKESATFDDIYEITQENFSNV